MSDDHTTIRVASDTKDHLKQYGEMGMSYDDVLRELLDRVEKMDDGTSER